MCFFDLEVSCPFYYSFLFLSLEFQLLEGESNYKSSRELKDF